LGGQRKDTKHEITPWLVWFHAWHVVGHVWEGGEKSSTTNEGVVRFRHVWGDKENAESEITPTAV